MGTKYKLRLSGFVAPQRDGDTLSLTVERDKINVILKIIIHCYC